MIQDLEKLYREAAAAYEYSEFLSDNDRETEIKNRLAKLRLNIERLQPIHDERVKNKQFAVALDIRHEIGTSLAEMRYLLDQLPK